MVFVFAEGKAGRWLGNGTTCRQGVNYLFVCRQLWFKGLKHTQKKGMRGQRVRRKIASREGRAFQVCLATFRTGESRVLNLLGKSRELE